MIDERKCDATHFTRKHTFMTVSKEKVLNFKANADNKCTVIRK